MTDPLRPRTERIAELRRLMVNASDTTEAEMLGWLAEFEDRIQAEAAPLAAPAGLREALRPFADFADPTGTMPATLPITQGSGMARRQLTMGDCYKARAALEAAPRSPEPPRLLETLPEAVDYLNVGRWPSGFTASVSLAGYIGEASDRHANWQDAVLEALRRANAARLEADR